MEVDYIYLKRDDWVEIRESRNWKYVRMLSH